MSLMSWTVELSVNMESIDAQHRQLVDALNAFRDATLRRESKSEVTRLLTEGLRLTMEHFAFEEKLMRENGYPGYVRHKQEHDNLVATVKATAQSLASGKKVDIRSLETTLKDWWLRHIKTVDKEYSAFLVAKGVK